MKIMNQLILLIPILLVMCFAPLGSDAFLNYTQVAFSQQQHNSSLQTEISTINNDISTQKVKVGDIEIAYRQIGNGSSGTPIVLISGCCTTMDMWSPSLLNELSKNQKVIIFDNRGTGESTLGTKPF
jgi:hypothetical protein